jgi:LPS-assembly lipoprotein
MNTLFFVILSPKGARQSRVWHKWSQTLDCFATLAMTNVKKVLALLLFPILLAACGFHPVYMKNSGQTGTAKDLGSVSIDSISDRKGQMLRNNLIDRMYIKGRPSKPTARLLVSLTATERELGFKKDATATRAQLELTANYRLLDIESGKELMRTTSRSLVSYNILDAQYATLSSKEDAYKRGLEELSEMITTRLSLYFAGDEKDGPKL